MVPMVSTRGSKVPRARTTASAAACAGDADRLAVREALREQLLVRRWAADRADAEARGDRRCVAHVIEVAMAQEDYIRTRHLIGYQADGAVSWAAVVIGVEQDHLVAVGQLVVGGPEIADHKPIVVVRHGASRCSRREALARIALILVPIVRACGEPR